MERLLFLAAGIEFRQAGLSSIRSEGPADYVLLAEYESVNGATRVRYALSRSGSPRVSLARLEIEVGLDHALDSLVADAVRRLLRAARIEAGPAADAKIEGVLSWPPPAKAEDAVAPAASDGTGKAEADRPAATFVASLSPAGLVLLGDITEYFQFGAGAVLTVGVNLPFATLSLTLDGRVSLIRVFNNAGVFGGPLSIVTAGPEIQIWTEPIGLFRFTAGLSGGAALLLVEDDGDTLAKTTPYAEAGAGARFAMGDELSVGVDVRFLMVFDSDALIMSAVVALTLRLEL